MNRIRELRESKGISQKQFALDIGVAQPTVSDWEKGKKEPRGKHRKKIADYFGVAMSDLFGDDDSPYPGVIDSDTSDAWYLRERLRRSPEMRLLFDAADKATADHLRAAAAVLKALEGDDD